MKKVKLVLTMAALVFSMMLLFSMSALALTDGDWEFQLLDNQVEITKYNGTETNVIIPSHIYNTPVTSISGRNLFPTAVSVTFPSTITKIPPYVCNTSYGQNKILETVVLPEGVQILEADAFHNCIALKNVTLPSTLTHIKGGWYEGAFQGCESLLSINFPENLVEIGRYAFSGTGLIEVDLSKTVKLTSVGSDTFKDCKNLKKVTLGPALVAVGQEMFYNCTALKEVVFTEAQKTIAANGFWKCAALESVILPVTLETVSDFAFCDCSSLKEVVLPYGVKTLGKGAFQGCPALRSVYAPDTITKTPSGSLMNGSQNAIVYCSANSKMAEYCKKQKVSYLTDNSVNSGIHVLYNGTRISFHAYGQSPELLNSRTLVPLRSIFEAMGAAVEWDGATSTAIAKRNGVEIRIQIGANAMYKNGTAVPVDVPAMLLNSRTMVPVRVIAEAFGADVVWNGIGKTVVISE